MKPQENCKWMVSVNCFSFNHHAYIEDTLNGFTMQETNFPYVCTIVDDASTDGEPEILRKYLQNHFDLNGNLVSRTKESDDYSMIFVQHKKNRNCYFVVYFLKYNHYHNPETKRRMKEYNREWNNGSKYIACCEGDDYWIDPMKLQKQYDFLESHPDYTLIGSNGIIQYSDFSKGIEYFNNHWGLRDVTFAELVNTWAFPTASLFFRKEILDNYPSWSKELHFGDDIIVMTSAIHGKVATLGEMSCVYRKGSGITKVMDKKQEYMAEQHKLFYTHLLEDTGDKFRDVLQSRINRDERNRRYWHIRSKSVVLAALMFPKRTCGVMLRVIKSFLKKCLRIV